MSDTVAPSIRLADSMSGSHSHIFAFFFQLIQESGNGELSPRDQAPPELYQ